MFRKGRRLFSTAAISLIVIAGLHTMGHFTSPVPGSELAALEATMNATRIDLGAGMKPSMGDILSSLSLLMTVSLVGFAALMLAIASAGSARMVRIATVISTGIVGAMVVLFGVYQVLPPFMTFFISELLLVSAIAGGTPDDVAGGPAT